MELISLTISETYCHTDRGQNILECVGEGHTATSIPSIEENDQAYDCEGEDRIVFFCLIFQCIRLMVRTFIVLRVSFTLSLG